MTKSNKSISPLRQRMLEDMTIRKPGPKTRKDYIRAVINFTRHLERSPDSHLADAQFSRLRCLPAQGRSVLIGAFH